MILLHTLLLASPRRFMLSILLSKGEGRVLRFRISFPIWIRGLSISVDSYLYYTHFYILTVKLSTSGHLYFYDTKINVYLGWTPFQHDRKNWNNEYSKKGVRIHPYRGDTFPVLIVGLSTSSDSYIDYIPTHDFFGHKTSNHSYKRTR